MRVLIVEDHLDVLECLRLYLAEHGHQVLTASTAEEAIARLEGSSPEMVFIDLLLPRGSGRQIVQEISKRGLPARMVVVTACDDLALRRELLSLGVSDYLFKPVTVRDLDALFVPPPIETPPEGQPK